MRARSSLNHPSRSRLEVYAAQNRAALTESEARLWSALSGGQLGVSFRRQVPLGNRFIVDFVAPRARLAVEVDGTYHARRRGADGRRDAKLRRLGCRVLRLPAALVMSDLTAAVELVRAALQRCVCSRQSRPAFEALCRSAVPAQVHGFLAQFRRVAHLKLAQRG